MLEFHRKRKNIFAALSKRTVGEIRDSHGRNTLPCGFLCNLSYIDTSASLTDCDKYATGHVNMTAIYRENGEVYLNYGDMRVCFAHISEIKSCVTAASACGNIDAAYIVRANALCNLLYRSKRLCRCTFKKNGRGEYFTLHNTFRKKTSPKKILFTFASVA